MGLLQDLTGNIWNSPLFQIVKRYHHVLLFPFPVWRPNSTILYHQIFFSVLLYFVSISGNVTGSKFKGEPINENYIFCLPPLTTNPIPYKLYRLNLQSAINTFRIRFIGSIDSGENSHIWAFSFYPIFIPLLGVRFRVSVFRICYSVHLF